MFCRECGMKNADNAKFCAGCGAKLEDFQVIDSQSEKNKLDNEEKANKKKRKAGMIVAVVMAVLAIVAVIFFFGEKVYQTIVEPSGEKYSTESGNEDGKVYQMIEESSDEKYVIQVYNEEGKHGYIDESGEEVIPCEYDSIYFCGDGYAIVTKERENDDRYGLIDSKGKIILPCEYDYIFWNKGIGALYYKDTGDKTKYGVIDAEGNIIPCEYDSAGYFGTNGLASVQNGELYGFVNRNNEIVIPMQYPYVAGGFGEGDLAPVANEDFKWGYINEKGEQIIPFQYDMASQFNKNGIALVSEEEQTYIINKSGEIVKKLSGKPGVSFYDFEKIKK